MRTFKRNQVEEAISRLYEPKALQPSDGLRTKIRRLLETDRALDRNSRSADEAERHFAFYSDEPPGSGIEVQFSAFQAFLIANGLRLLDHGWTQGHAVRILRRARDEMEKEYSRVLGHDPTWLFDEAEIKRNARVGGFAFTNNDPVLLVLVSSTGAVANELDPKVGVARGETGAVGLAWELQKSGGSGYSMFELTTLARHITDALAKTEPRRRGRPES